MAVAIHVYIRPKGAADDAPVQVEHIFYGRDEAEADKIRLAHLAGCENFALAEAEGRTFEDVEELPDHDVPNTADFDDEEGGEDDGDDGDVED